MDFEKLAIWHLISDDGWVKGATESNLPSSALITIKTEWRNVDKTGVISSKTYKEYQVDNNDVLRAAYDRYGIFPNFS